MKAGDFTAAVYSSDNLNTNYLAAGDPLEETPAIGAAVRKRDERSSVEVGRAPWWSVTGGCNEHEFFDEHYAR